MGDGWGFLKIYESLSGPTVFLQPSNPEVRESHKNNGAPGIFLPLYAEIRNSSLTFSVLWKNGGKNGLKAWCKQHYIRHL
jgi:hypothetical protein